MKKRVSIVRLCEFFERLEYGLCEFFERLEYGLCEKLGCYGVDYVKN